MNTKDLYKQSAEFGHLVVGMYLQDLSDADLLVRSVPGANHIAWQLGHLINSNAEMLRAIGCDAPAVPEKIVKADTKENASSDDPSLFCGKAEYLEWAAKMKAATFEAIDKIDDARLDEPGPERMREYAPTIGSVMLILCNHWMMHAGQFVPIRRKLGKAPLF